MRIHNFDAGNFLFVCDAKRMFFKSGVTSDTKTNAANWLDFKTFQTRIIISAQQNFRLKLLMIFLKWFKEWLEFETCKKSLSTKQRHSFIQVDSYRKRDTNHVLQKVFPKKILPGNISKNSFESLDFFNCFALIKCTDYTGTSNLSKITTWNFTVNCIVHIIDNRMASFSDIL